MTTWQFTYNGLTFGAGTNIGVRHVAGLRLLPDVRAYATQRDGGLGTFSSPDLANGRTIDMDIDVVAPPGGTTTDMIDQLANAFVLQSAPQPLIFTEPGRAQKVIFCRVRHAAPDMDPAYEMGITTIPVQFYADDPRIYGYVPRGAVLSAATMGSLTAPWTAPITVTGSSASSAVCTNGGNSTASPVIVISGPVTTPTVSNLTTGQVMQILLTLNTGDQLIIDSGKSQITLNGVQQAGSVTPGTPFITLSPGDNSLAYGGATGSCALIWADTWIS